MVGGGFPQRAGGAIKRGDARPGLDLAQRRERPGLHVIEPHR
jgi:hypothetical protein